MDGSMSIKVEVSVLNWNELTIKEVSHSVEGVSETKVENYPIYVFPRYTNQVVDY